MKKKINLKGKKKFIIAAIAVVVIMAIVAPVLFRRLRMKNVQSAEMTVQTATAEKGSVSTTVVGTGSLAESSGTDVKIPAGIEIEELLVENGDTVKAGQELATVNEASVASALLEVKENIESVEDAIDDLSSDASDSTTTEYLQAKVLEGELEYLEDTETLLTEMMSSKAIVATKSGVISAINVSEGDTVSSGASGTTSTGNSNSNLQVSADVTTALQSSSVIQCTAEEESTGLVFLTADVDGNEGEQTTEEEAVVETVTITDCQLNVTAPVTGATPQNEVKETTEFTGTISWNCSAKTFQADTVYTATIKLTAKDGYAFSTNIIPEVAGATVTSEVRQNDAGKSILYIKAKFEKTQSAQTGNQDAGTTKENSGSDSGQSTSVSKNAAASGSASVSGGGTSTASGTASAESVSVSTEYTIEEASVFTIASAKEVTVSINVDELDILTVKEGQTATVTLDALDGESFEGTITSVSHTASSSGSSVKYPVEITLEKTEDMLIGMSASATIIIDEAEDAVVIPVSALQERGNSTFVYTEEDSEGNLSGEVEVEVGLSNGTQVEIRSGLEEGDTVYYMKSSETDSSESGGMGMGGMSGGSMPDMGEMPGGGEMPSGGSMPSGGGMQGGPGGQSE